MKKHALAFIQRTLKAAAIVGLLLAPTAYSWADPATDFTSAWSQILRRCDDQGFTQVGKLNLSRLRKDISSIKWEISRVGVFGGSGGHRTSSIFLAKEGIIVVNASSLPLLSEAVIPLLSLHEVLSAVGYDDENYELSISLDRLCNQKSEQHDLFEDILFAMPPKSQKNKVYATLAGGGATSVGGGGDGTALEFKVKLLEAAIAKSLPVDSARPLVLQILKSSVEPDWVFETQAPPAISFTERNVQVIIPSMTWMTLKYAGAAEPMLKSQMVSEVLEKISDELIKGTSK